MKKLYPLLFTLLLSAAAGAQAPQSFNYQAIVRDQTGNVVANRSIVLRIAVLNGSASGPTLYQESFTVTTNQFGLVNVSVGTGTPVSGSFPTIDWSASAKYLQTAINFNDGNGFQVMGASQLVSVPYALFAGNTGGGNNSWTVTGNNIHNGNTGNVGIGTTAPSARLHVKDSSVLFSGASGLLTTTPGNPPVSGIGIRAFWYPDKAAFRAGGVDNGITFIPNNPDFDFPDGTHAWDKDSIGLFSFASGFNTRAKGMGAAAFGIGNAADGDGSFASGFSSSAAGLGGFALGNRCDSRGGSFAFGSLNLAAFSSVTMGSQDTASNSSIALGTDAVATGASSFAIGRIARAAGIHSFAIGTNVTASGRASFVMGNDMDDQGKTGVFMIGDASGHHNDVPIAPAFDNEFIAFFQNGYRLFTNTDEDGIPTGVQLQTEDNAWSSLSDSTKKSHFLVLDGEQVLQKLNGFNALGSWNYKGQDPKRHRHYGPMAQDFHNAFGFDGIGASGNDTLINSADLSGILFIATHALVKRTDEMNRTAALQQAAIQQLTAANQQLRDENQQLSRQYAQASLTLINRLALLETQLNKLSSLVAAKFESNSVAAVPNQPKP